MCLMQSAWGIALLRIQHLDVNSKNPDVNYQDFFGIFIENSQIKLLYEANKCKKVLSQQPGEFATGDLITYLYGDTL